MDGHSSGSFLAAPAHTPATRRLYDQDAEDPGYVMNSSRLWGHLPAAHEQLMELIGTAADHAGLSFRDRGILVTATASTMGDSYCSLAWGKKLSSVADPELAAGVLSGTDEGLSPSELALARWARRVAADPNGTTTADLDELRAAGYDDRQVAAITLFVGLRIAFSTVNDALGAQPDRELGESAPGEVLRAVTWGRPVAE